MSSLTPFQLVWLRILWKTNLKKSSITFPEKQPRSCLAPYQDLIYELRRRGLTYREIVGLLSKELGLHVVSTTIIRFVHAHSKAKRKRQLPRDGQGVATLEAASRAAKERKLEAAYIREIQARIAGIKSRPPQVPIDPKPFRYDPDKPLRLPPRSLPLKTK